MAAAWPILADHQYTGCSYKAPDGTTTSALTVMLDAEGAESVGELVELDEQTVNVVLPVSDLADPDVGGRFTIDGASWTVMAPPRKRAGLWSCPCARREEHRIPAQKFERD